MKQIILTTYCAVSICLFSNQIYAQNEWVPYREPYITQNISQNIILQTNIENIYIRPPVLMYDWMPYYINQMAILEKRNNWFCQQQYIIYQPTIQWVYQPVWKY